MIHDYLSTYCLHELHDACRLTCKTCGARCRCRCHKEKMKNLGKIAYDAYCRATGGVSLVNGDKLPEFSKLSAKMRMAWEASAQAVAYAQEVKDSSRL